MSSAPGPVRINIHPSFEVLAATTAARLITKLLDVQNERGEATVVLTGGTVGIATLKAVADSAACLAVDWSKVNFWWGDERFLPADDADRNARQAEDVLLSKIGVDPERVHRMGSSDEFADSQAAAERYAQQLALAAAAEHPDEDPEGLDTTAIVWQALPRFDVLLLGIGPDGHIASLFPEMAGIRVNDALVVGVENSPKPPPSRVSLTLPTINSAQEVWMVVAGEDKAGAVGLALAGANPVQVPAAGPAGRIKTLWLLDQDAAAKVPENLFLGGAS
ncbi:6-phosphogluconolactonase [Psychromicrobium lacuslunae]|uniref:6-phosphogluconolactonase n=1 Tax=Psychromicrobium lacuslunae TaxID=1618207 RepID=A0A0D4BXK9_9MICC|nr:6-phosphogluconolactonase [Psychromicrobium lacuslunae]AJT40870.1 6-phosphogluconolactonase [Psychromicrobium lacuslunae]